MVFHGLKWAFTLFSCCFTFFFTLCVGPHHSSFICYLIPVYRSEISFLPFTGSQIKRNAFMITMTDSIFEGVNITRLIQIGWDENSRFLIVLFLSIMSLTPNSRGTFVNFMTNSSLKATMPPDLVQMGWASVDPGWSMHIHVYPVTLNRRRCTLIVFCRGLFLQ
jgi:hypothetical protein